MDLAPGRTASRASTCRAAARWTRHYYRKVGTRQAQAISKVCFAGSDRRRGRARTDVRLAFGSVAPTCVRATAAEASLRGRPLEAGAITAARAALVHDIAPIDDLRSTARYRLTVAANLMAEFLSGVAPEGPGLPATGP